MDIYTIYEHATSDMDYKDLFRNVTAHSWYCMDMHLPLLLSSIDIMHVRICKQHLLVHLQKSPKTNLF